MERQRLENRSRTGKNSIREGWDSQRSSTPDNITLGAMRTGVKQYK